MHSRSLLYAQFIILSILAALHLLGIEYDLYWQYLWLDTVTHWLGGMWVGVFVLYVRTWYGYPLSVAWSIAGAVALGIVWEIFEVVAGLTPEANYWFDTSIDLLMDTVGGATGALIFRVFAKNREPSETML